MVEAGGGGGLGRRWIAGQAHPELGGRVRKTTAGLICSETVSRVTAICNVHHANSCGPGGQLTRASEVTEPAAMIVMK